METATELQVGRFVDVQSSIDKKWYPVKIVTIFDNGNVRVHYPGWTKDSDETVAKSKLATQIAPLFSRSEDRRKWDVGDKVDYLSLDPGEWIQVPIVAVDHADDSVAVQLDQVQMGLAILIEQNSSEWLNICSEYIAPLHTFTKRKSKRTSHQANTPAPTKIGSGAVRSAPSTQPVAVPVTPPSTLSASSSSSSSSSLAQGPSHALIPASTNYVPAFLPRSRASRSPRRATPSTSSAARAPITPNTATTINTANNACSIADTNVGTTNTASDNRTNTVNTTKTTYTTYTNSTSTAQTPVPVVTPTTSLSTSSNTAALNTAHNPTVCTSWLGPLLRTRQVSEQHILLCEEALVQNEGFTDAKLFASLREPDLAAYLSHIGIVQKGVQMKVVELHKLLQLSQELCGGSN